MLYLKIIGFSALMALVVWSPITTAQDSIDPASAAISSVKLKALTQRFLEKGDEPGFWKEVSRLAEAGDYPIVEEIDSSSTSPDSYVQLTFLYKQRDNPPENVLLFANINHVLAEELLFERFGQTGVFFKTVEVPPGVRFHYRIIENDPLTGLFAAAKYGTRLHVLGRDPDPLNPNRLVRKNALGKGRDVSQTWVELAGAAPQPYLAEKGNKRGSLISEEHQSALLGYPRRIFTYLPPDHDPQLEYPMMILLDAGEYFSSGSLQLTLDNLISDGSIPPLVVLGIDGGNKAGRNQRNEEFTCNPAFMAFLDEELLPWFISQHKVSPDPTQRIIAGSSFGGLFAAYFAFNHPDVVANVLSQSGSFHWGKQGDAIPFEWLIRKFAFNEKQPVKFYMEVGVLEGEYSWASPGFPHQILSHRHFKTVLEMKGYDAVYREYGGGHEMLSWRGGIADGLKHLFRAKDLAQAKQHPG